MFDLQWMVPLKLLRMELALKKWQRLMQGLRKHSIKKNETIETIIKARGR